MLFRSGRHEPHGSQHGRVRHGRDARHGRDGHGHGKSSFTGVVVAIAFCGAFGSDLPSLCANEFSKEQPSLSLRVVLVDSGLPSLCASMCVCVCVCVCV